MMALPDLADNLGLGNAHCLNKTVTQHKWLPQIGRYQKERFT